MPDEKIYIVDKDDNVLTVKTRVELKDSDCWRIISIWITDSNGRVLL